MFTPSLLRTPALGLALVASLAVAAPSSATTQTVTSTGTFTMPSGVDHNSIHVTAQGGSGGQAGAQLTSRGAQVSGDLVITTGQPLQLTVGYGGGAGASSQFGSASAAGGGASDIRAGQFTLNDRLLVAGGSGGGGGASVVGAGGQGGAGGGFNGGSSTGLGPVAGGAGGGGGFGFGNDAGAGSCCGAGGGGGGGWFGGAAGASGSDYGGGGGGGGTNYGRQSPDPLVTGASYVTNYVVAPITAFGATTPSVTITYNTAPTAGLTPAGGNDFGNLNVNRTSANVTYTLSNTGEGGLDITSIDVGGSTEFEQSNNCGSVLAGGTSCTITTRFDPETAGAQSATLNVTTEVGTSTRALSGFATVPVAGLAPAGDHDFGLVQVGSVSPDYDYTLSNSGNGPMNITAINVGGSTNFTATNTCGSSLAANSSCTIHTRFNPQTSAPKSATLTVNTEGGNTTRALTGTGGTPAASLTPAADHDFGSLRIDATSPDFDYTLENTGDGIMLISSISVGASTAFERSGTCGATLAAGASCVIHTRFDPETGGSQTATLTVNTNGGNATRALSGFATAPVLSLTPAGPHNFGEQIVDTTSADFDYTLENTGNAVMNISAIGVGASTDFERSGTCGATLAAAATCTIHVRFDPESAGAKTGTLTVTTDGGNATRLMSGLAGTPVIVLTASTGRAFGSWFVGMTTGDYDYTLENTGDIALSITSIDVGTTDFGQDNDCGSSLLPAATCTIHTHFSPGSAGPKTTSLTLSTPVGNPTRTLTGTGTDFPTLTPTPPVIVPDTPPSAPDAPVTPVTPVIPPVVANGPTPQQIAAAQATCRAAIRSVEKAAASLTKARTALRKAKSRSARARAARQVSAKKLTYSNARVWRNFVCS